ncbi:hypothetical protein [Krasilnikovia sp. M28-CT-15]|uniref:hypothetical protein n=1 Tax=Krasilnikovia sp. M28-CT-15 TaxID=3373540 RepID=UPI00399CF6CE
MSRLRVGTRLVVCLGAVLVLFSIAALIGVAALRSQDRAVRHMQQMLVLTRDVQEIKYFNSDVSGWQVAYAWEAALGDPAAAVKPDAVSRAGYLEVVGRLRAHLASVNTTAMTAEEKRTFQALRADWDAFLAMDDKIAKMFAEGTPASVKRANDTIGGPSWDIYYRILGHTKKLVDSAKVRSAAAAAAAESASRSAQIQLGLASLAALLLAIPFIRAVRLSIVRPLAVSVTTLRALASRDLTRRVDTSRWGGELREMGIAVNEAVEVLRDAVAQIRSDANQLSGAAGLMGSSMTQIAVNSDDATTRVEGAAAAAAEVGDNAQKRRGGGRGDDRVDP